MSATMKTDAAVELLAQEFWSPIFVPELKQSTVLPSLVSREYDGEIKEAGDKVNISQILRPTAEMKTVGQGHEKFTSSKIQTAQVSVTADRVITASYKFDSLAMLQTQLGQKESTIRQGLIEAMEIKLNDLLYSLVSPSSSPDHLVTGVADFNAAQLLSTRLLASQAKWSKMNRWLLVDPSYYNDLLSSQTLTSRDYVDDMPLVGGEMVAKRNGFFIVEDNSDGLLTHSVSGTADAALAFTPDFMYLVMQEKPVFKISDLHSNEQHGFLISCKMVVGAGLGIAGANKHIVTKAS